MIALMRALRATLFATLPALAFLTALLGGTERVAPGTAGVRESMWGGGVEGVDLGPGLHLVLPGLHRLQRVDMTLQLEGFGVDVGAGFSPVLDLRTREGNSVQVAATALLRVAPGEAHALAAEGLVGAWRERARAVVRVRLAQDLAQLTAEELARPADRGPVLARSLEALRADLAAMHIVPEAILVHRVALWPQYEALLQEKQLTRQKALLAEASKRVEEAMQRNAAEREVQAELAALRAEFDLRIEVLRTELRLAISALHTATQAFVAARRAEADGSFERELAAGNLAVYRAESLGEQLKRAAQASPGGRLEVLRRFAGGLRLEEIVLDPADPGVPMPLDLAAMAQRLLAER